MSLDADEMLAELTRRAQHPDRGRERAPEVPDFLRGHDYAELSPAHVLRFFELLDLLKPTPSHEQCDPAAWDLTDVFGSGRIALPPPGRSRTDWSPRPDAEPLPVSVGAGIPKVWFTIWTGWGANRVLRPAGRSAMFWEQWSKSAQIHGDVTFVHLTEATRAEVRAALAQEQEPDAAADVWHLVRWAEANRITLINTDELLAIDDADSGFDSDSDPGWISRTLHARRARRDGPSLAEFSDLLRLWLVYRFGGLYLDGNKPLLSDTVFSVVAASVPGFGGGDDSNAAFLAFPRHPVLRTMLDQVRANFRKDQVELARDGFSYQGIDITAVNLNAALRLPVIERTGPAMVHRCFIETGWSSQSGRPFAPPVPIPHHHPYQAAWLLDDPEPAARTTPDAEIHATVADLADRLISDIDDARGHLDLIAIEGALADLPDPDAALTAILRHLASREELRTRIRGVFDHHWKHDRPNETFTLTPFAYQATAARHLHYLPQLPSLIGDPDGVWLLHKRAARAILLPPGRTAPTPADLAAEQQRTRPDDFGLHRLPDDPWPRADLDEALDHAARTLRPDELEKARTILTTVAGANRSALDTRYFPPQLLGIWRRMAAAALALPACDPTQPLPLPGSEGRLLMISALNGHGGLISNDAAATLIGAIAHIHRHRFGPEAS